MKYISLMKRNTFKYLRMACTSISPKLTSVILHKVRMGEWPDVRTPKSYNEKLIWLKHHKYHDDELVSKCADKYAVRDYVRSLGCKEILNPIFEVYDDVHDIDWEGLPDRFVVKLNTGCGANLICNDKSSLDITETERRLKKWMKRKYYLNSGEMHYKGIKPLILFERNLSDSLDEPPSDYKFYCFNGVAEYVMVCGGRGTEEEVTFDFYDKDWNYYQFFDESHRVGRIEKPEGMDDAFSYAEKLSHGFPFVRTDLYIVEGKVIFGEMTFTPSASVEVGILPEGNRALSGKLVINQN